MIDSSVAAILVVEDDPETRELLVDVLSRQGHVVSAAIDLASARTRVETESFDLIVLDRMLPDGSGLELIEALTEQSRRRPVLMLTARSDVGDRVTGLEAGADDYLGKPFAVAEFLARVRALLRRSRSELPEEVRIGPVAIDRLGRTVRVGTSIVSLTMREFALLDCLLTARGRALSREEILDEVWPGSGVDNSSSLEVLISRLRRKLSRSDSTFPIKTLRGFGYSLTSDP